MPHHHLEPLFAERAATHQPAPGRPGWRRLYPDLPGMGRTPGAEWIGSQEDMLEVALGFLDKVLGAGRRFALAGVSYGGYLAMAVAQRRAADLSGVLLWTPAMTMSEEKTQAPAPRPMVHDPAVTDLVQPEEALWLQVAVIQTPETLATFRSVVKPGLMAADHAFLARFDANPDFAFDVAAFPQPLEVPTLILAGRQDAQVGYAGAVRLLESFPRATLAVLDRAGHGLAGEQRTIFRAVVSDWLDRVEAELE
jgi:pimeloyl-ACP methyl ester carboxylesterase